jgi:hypothetical protein
MMRSFVAILSVSVFLLSAQAPEAATKDSLRQKIAELKIKAFEIQTQVDLLEQQLKDLELAESLQPLPIPAKGAAPKLRCAGHTKDGARCTRNAESGSRFCWQHRPRR